MTRIKVSFFYVCVCTSSCLEMISNLFSRKKNTTPYNPLETSSTLPPTTSMSSSSGSSEIRSTSPSPPPPPPVITTIHPLDDKRGHGHALSPSIKLAKQQLFWTKIGIAIVSFLLLSQLIAFIVQVSILQSGVNSLK